MKKSLSLFKSVVSKGKSMLSGNKKQTTPQKNDESDEDDDLIEIGKTQKTGTSTFSRHISNLVGSKLQKEDKYVN
jgi:hypothetical protein